MNEYLSILQRCKLFHKISPEEILCLLENTKTRVSSYSPNQIIVFNNDNCTNLGIILEGKASAQKIHASGKSISIAEFAVGDIFGDPLIFSSSTRYSATLTAYQKSKIMFIPRDALIALFKSNSLIMENFLQLLSDKVLHLNQKINILSYSTIREKVCNYLLTEFEKQGSTTLQMQLTRSKMAESLGIPRPSLSRELINMRKERLLDFDKNIIKLKNVFKLQELLLK